MRTKQSDLCLVFFFCASISIDVYGLGDEGLPSDQLNVVEWDYVSMLDFADSSGNVDTSDQDTRESESSESSSATTLHFADPYESVLRLRTIQGVPISIQLFRNSRLIGTAGLPVSQTHERSAPSISPVSATYADNRSAVREELLRLKNGDVEKLLMPLESYYSTPVMIGFPSNLNCTTENRDTCGRKNSERKIYFWILVESIRGTARTQSYGPRVTYLGKFAPSVQSNRILTSEVVYASGSVYTYSGVNLGRFILPTRVQCYEPSSKSYFWSSNIYNDYLSTYREREDPHYWTRNPLPSRTTIPKWRNIYSELQPISTRVVPEVIEHLPKAVRDAEWIARPRPSSSGEKASDSKRNFRYLPAAVAMGSSVGIFLATALNRGCDQPECVAPVEIVEVEPKAPHDQETKVDSAEVHKFKGHEGTMALSTLMRVRQNCEALANHLGAEDGAIYREMIHRIDRIRPEVEMRHDLSQVTLDHLRHFRSFVIQQKELIAAHQSIPKIESLVLEFYKALLEFDRVLDAESVSSGMPKDESFEVSQCANEFLL